MTLKTVAVAFITCLVAAIGCFCAYWPCYAVGWLFLGEYNWYLLEGLSDVGFFAGLGTFVLFPELILTAVYAGIAKVSSHKLPIFAKIAHWLVQFAAIALGSPLGYLFVWGFWKKFLSEDNKDLIQTVFAATGFLAAVASIVAILALIIVGLVELGVQKWNSRKK